ncbi:MAG: hypothetical protein FK730_13845, partial [Asgard group archaeon]|nr:hypothetical protein [Asgard group archaeon]
LSPKVFFRPGLIDIFKNQKINVSKTINTNIQRLGVYLKTRKELVELDYKENYDAIFSDFEPHTSVIGRRLKKPVFSIDHQHSLFHPATLEIDYTAYERILTFAVLNIMQPYFTHSYALDYVNEIYTHDNITLFPLLEKEELYNFERKIENHFVVYLTKNNPEDLIEFFSNFPDENFYIYGFDKHEEFGNITLKETSRNGFLTDLASSKGFIGNGGFNTTWECCILNKVMWLVPFSNQTESLSNLYRLEKLNLAYVSIKLDVNEFHNFIEWAKNMNCEPKHNLKLKHPSELLSLVYKQIENFHSENLPKPIPMKRRIRHNNRRWQIKNEIRNEILI